MIASSTKCKKCGAVLECGDWGHCSRCMAEELLRYSSAPLPTPHGEALFQLGNYALIEEIARGGMGIVFRARQVGLDREVAVKLMREVWLARDEDIRRFKTEAAAAAKLRHPNIVAIHEVGEEQGQHYFAMDLIQGMNLAERTREGPLPVRKAAQIAVKIAEAVQHAHEHGVLHRDLKPSNVLVDASEEPFVTDFGVARAFDTDSSLTFTGQVLGTPGYMPPEQASGKNSVGPPADIYSLGALLYHLLTGRAPFVGGNNVETLRHVVEQEPVPPQLLNPEVPEDLSSVTLKCLSKEPTHRYSSASVFAADLKRFLAGEPTLARPTGHLEQAWRWCQRKPALTTAIFCAAVVGVLGFSGIIWQWRRAEAQRVVAEENGRSARQGLYAADMNLVHQTLAQHNLSGARELLRAHRPKPGQLDFRGWEWWYYATLCRGEEASLIATNGSAIKCLVSSPGLDAVVAGRVDGTIELWDIAEGRLKKRVAKSTNDIGGLALDDEGKIVATRSWFSSVEVWDMGDPSKLRTLEAVESGVVMSLSSRNKFIAMAPGSKVPYDVPESDAMLTSVRNYETGERIVTLPESGEHSLFLKDGKILVTGSWKGTVKIWDTEGWRLVRTLPSTGYVLDMVLSPDDRLLVTTSWEGAVLLWDVATGRLLGQFKGHSSRVWVARFSPDGSVLATGSGDQTIALWDVASQRELTRLKGHERELRGLAFSSDGKQLASTELNATGIRVWKIDGSAGTNAHLQITSIPVFDPEGRMIAAGNPSGKVSIWDIETKRTKLMLSSEPNAVGFLSDRNTLITASVPTPLPTRPGLISGLKYWDVQSGALQRSVIFSSSNQVAAAVTLSPDGGTLASGDTNMNVILWDARSGAIREKLTAGSERVWNLTFSANGQMLAVGSSGNIRLWHLQNPRTYHDIPASGLAVAFSPDSETLAVGAYKEIQLFNTAISKRRERVRPRPSIHKEIQIFDSKTAKLKATLRGHREGLYWLSFSRDGRTLASACEDIKLWNLATGREVASFQQDAPFLFVGFSPDGKSLLGGRIGQAAVWRADTGDLRLDF